MPFVRIRTGKVRVRASQIARPITYIHASEHAAHGTSWIPSRKRVHRDAVSPADPSQSASLFLCITFFPSERLATAVLALVSGFCGMVLEDANVSSRFYMAAHELAENITKYSTGPRVSLEVALEEDDRSYVMKIRARNEASPERLREVEQRLLDLKTASDPVQHYDALISETALREGVSGLGLARVRAEGGLDVDYKIEGNELTIIAHAPIERWRMDEQLKD